MVSANVSTLFLSLFVELEVNLKVFSPVVILTSSALWSYANVSISPVQITDSLGGAPAGINTIPLALPFSSVTIGALKEDRELPGIPVNLISGTTHLLIFLPSK